MLMIYTILVCLAVFRVVHGIPPEGDERLRRVCKQQDFDQAGGELIEPSNRTSCALFAESELYAPYKLKVTARDGVSHLTGTVPGAGNFDGLLVACGKGNSKICLQIYSSPGNKINGAFMIYSNAEVDFGIHKDGPVAYVASLDCKEGKPGQRYFEFRRAPSKSELENIKTHYGISVDSEKLAACLENKDKAFE